MAAAAAAAAAAEVVTAAEASTPTETPSESSVDTRPTPTAAEKRRHNAAVAGTGSDRQHHRRHHHHHHRRRRHHHEKPTSTGPNNRSTDVVAPPPPPLSTSPPSSSDLSHRRQMYGTYHAWALKTYGDSAKTKTVTRKKYNRIVKILKGEEHSNAENSKFRFWVKAKGFRVGPPPSPSGSAVTAATETGRRGDHVLYVPCSAVKNGDNKEDSVFKRVAVVENFFDIIYNVHVEMDGRGGKHAGQKRTYKAIAETYAFLPREAVTNFLMQCHDCQKRMHAGVTPNGEITSSDATATTSSTTITAAAAVTKTTTTATTATETEATDGDVISDIGGARSGVNENEDDEETEDNELDDGAGTSSPPHSTVDSDRCSEPPEIDFSIPITTTYMKHYRSLGYSTEEALNLENEVHDNASRDGTTSSPEPSPVEIEEEMSPSSVKEDEDDDKVSIAVNGYDSPLDMSKADRTNGNDSVNTSSSLALQPPPSTLPLPPPPPPPFSASHPLNMSLNGETNRQVAHQQHRQSPSSAASMSSLPPPARFNPSLAFRGRNCNNHHSRHQSRLQNENHLDGVSSHDELNNGICREGAPSPEDLSAIVKDEDDDEDDEVDEKLDAHKFDPERLKAFNMFVRLFVDENLDRMVPISKQPKEKIQAIIDSCARQFPEFSERSRKRIRTYLKSCRRTKRCRDQNGWEPGRPTPPHLTSAMAEQILAAACDNESNNAKRMRLGLEPMSTAINERVNGEATVRQSAALKAYSETHHPNHRHHNHRNGVTPATNGSSGIYTRGTRSNSVGSRSPNNHLATLQGGGPADLSMKKSTSPSSQQQQQHHQSAGKCPLNQSEVSAVRQLIAGYRESAAFLVRSADELEQLLLQQN